MSVDWGLGDAENEEERMTGNDVGSLGDSRLEKDGRLQSAI